MRKNKGKLNFTKNRRASWFCRERIKISKQSISLPRLGECSKSNVTPLRTPSLSWISWCILFSLCLSKTFFNIAPTIDALQKILCIKISYGKVVHFNSHNWLFLLDILDLIAVLMKNHSRLAFENGVHLQIRLATWLVSSLLFLT